MLSIFWVVTSVSSSAVIITAWIAIKSFTKESVNQDFRNIQNESPFTGIYIPQKDTHLLNQNRSWFQVTFKSTGSDTIWMTPDEIINHCQRHQQPVPSIIANAEHNFNIGDSLLKVII